MVIPNKIKELRKKQRLTQEDLSAKSKVGRGNLSEIENGRGNPSVETMRRIAIALNVSLGDLFDTLAQPPPVSIEDQSILRVCHAHGVKSPAELAAILDRYALIQKQFAPATDEEIKEHPLRFVDENVSQDEFEGMDYHSERKSGRKNATTKQ